MKCGWSEIKAVVDLTGVGPPAHSSQQRQSVAGGIPKTSDSQSDRFQAAAQTMHMDGDCHFAERLLLVRRQLRCQHGGFDQTSRLLREELQKCELSRP